MCLKSSNNVGSWMSPQLKVMCSYSLVLPYTYKNDPSRLHTDFKVKKTTCTGSLRICEDPKFRCKNQYEGRGICAEPQSGVRG